MKKLITLLLLLTVSTHLHAFTPAQAKLSDSVDNLITATNDFFSDHQAELAVRLIDEAKRLLSTRNLCKDSECHKGPKLSWEGPNSDLIIYKPIHIEKKASIVKSSDHIVAYLVDKTLHAFNSKGKIKLPQGLVTDNFEIENDHIIVKRKGYHDVKINIKGEVI